MSEIDFDGVTFWYRRYAVDEAAMSDSESMQAWFPLLVLAPFTLLSALMLTHVALCWKQQRLGDVAQWEVEALGGIGIVSAIVAGACIGALTWAPKSELPRWSLVVSIPVAVTDGAAGIVSACLVVTVLWRSRFGSASPRAVAAERAAVAGSALCRILRGAAVRVPALGRALRLLRGVVR